MKIAAGGLVRTVSGLNIRQGPKVAPDNIMATAVRDALLHPTAAPRADGWLAVELWGWTDRDAPSVLLIDPAEDGAVKATVKRPAALLGMGDMLAGGWRAVRLAGYVDAGYLDVVDGPA